MIMRSTRRLKSIISNGYMTCLPAFCIALAAAAANLLRVHRKWESARGFEYEWIGRAIASGNGFSFPGDSRWLFSPGDPNLYFPTAWSEPFSPFLIGINFFIFGEHGKIVLLSLNVLFHFITALFLFWIVRRICNPIAAYIALVLFTQLPSWVVTGYLGNSVIAGLAILLFYQIATCLLNLMSWKLAVLTGLFLGGMALIHAGTLLFTPVLALYIVLVGRFGRRAVQTAFLITLVAGVTVLPWTIRNYLTFGEFVPVRNGVGQILHVSNLSLGRTSQPQGSVPEKVPVPWRSRNLWSAYQKLMDRDNRRALERYSEKLIAAETGADYRAANEAVRDKYLAAAAKQYILEHPVDTIRLSLIKGVHFFFINWPHYRYNIPIGSIITFIAGIGAIFYWKKKEVAIAAILIMAYSAPYLLTAPYFYRYRYPTEPLVIILFSYLFTSIIVWVHKNIVKIREKQF